MCVLEVEFDVAHGTVLVDRDGGRGVVGLCAISLLAIATAFNMVNEAANYLEIELYSSILAVCGICACVACFGGAVDACRTQGPSRASPT